MIKLNKFIKLVAAMTMALSLVGCGGSQSSSSSQSVLDAIAESGELKVGISQDKLGFALENTETKQLEGLEVMISEEIAKDIAELKNVDEVKVTYTKTNAKTRTSMLDEGSIDMAVSSITITQERAKSWNFSSYYFNDEVSVMAKKDVYKEGVKSFKDAGSVDIGVILGTTSKDALIDYMTNELGMTDYADYVNFKEFNTNDEVLIALDSGAIDGYCIDYTQLFAYKTDAYEILGEEFGDFFCPQPLGIATRYKTAVDGEDEEFTKFIQDEIRDFWESGKMDKWFEECGYQKQDAPTDLDLEFGPYHHGEE